MKLSEIRQIVETTADPAFAIAPNGQIAAWNDAAESLFGLERSKAIGQFCGDVVKGEDECGKLCSEDCAIFKKTQLREAISHFDINIQAKDKRQWCNVSVLVMNESKTGDPYTLHIARPSDLNKRFELLMRDFITTNTNLPIANLGEVMQPRKSIASGIDLTKREKEILKLLAKGVTSVKIGDKLFISRTTVNNHVQNIMKKLGAHSRLEAVRRAEQAGLI